MSQFWEPLEESFKENANPEKAAQMKKYMKGQFAYYGLQKPVRTQYEKAFYQQITLPPKEKMDSLILEAWNKSEREWVYVAMAFMEKYKKQWTEKDVELLEKLILNKSWWDTVDYLCIKIGGAYFKKFPDLISTKTIEWIESENIWLNRSAILYQLKFKEATDWPRLQTYILSKTDSKEFFIQKAIGWALREYSKREPERVIDFIEQNERQLAALSKREGMKWINKN